MTTDQLEAFITAAESPTFFDAAETLHTTQSSISKKIKSLEKELDVSLFSRSQRKAELTPLGLVFYRDAKNLLSQYRTTMFHLRQFQKEQDQTLRIGTLPFQAQYHLPTVFQQFRVQNPDIRLVVEEAEEGSLLQHFEEDQYDLVILRESMLDQTMKRITTIDEDRLVAIFPAVHPLAAHGAQTVSLADLTGDTFLTMNPNTSIYTVCTTLLQKYKMSQLLIGTGRPESILNQITSSGSIGLLPENTCRLFQLKDLCMLPLDPPVRLPIVLAQKKAAVQTAAMKQFIRLIRPATALSKSL